MVTSRARGRPSARPLDRSALTLLAAFLRRSVALGVAALEVRGDRLRLGATTARTATTLVVLVAGGLGATLGAVRHRALRSFLAFLARRRRQAGFGDRVRDGTRDQLY